MKVMNELTPSEELVMKAIWDSRKEPVLQDVLLQVNDIRGKGWAPQTVSTYLAKLCKKGYILLMKNGKISRYRVLADEREYQKRKLKKMLMYIYNNDEDLLQEDMKQLVG